MFPLFWPSCAWQVVGTVKGVAVIHHDYSHPLHERAMCSAICLHVDCLCYQESAYPPSPDLELLPSPEEQEREYFFFFHLWIALGIVPNAKGILEMLLVKVKSLSNVLMNAEGKKGKKEER